ncbi:MAG: hypothetical protein HGN29_03575, partial [Asgard group archaeon]|nr:hypothetical protein [Asgard group archaeon]
MFQSLRWKAISLLLISSVMLVPIQIYAEDNYLISRIIDAEYPPNAQVQTDRQHTSFKFTLEQQTVNPTSSPITIPYVCSPLPFPYLRTNLRNKSLIVKHEFTFQWP